MEKKDETINNQDDKKGKKEKRKNKKSPLALLLKLFIVWFLIMALFSFGAVFILKNYKNLGATKTKVSTEMPDKSEIEKFINENLMPQGGKATVQEIVEENGLYKIAIDLGNGNVVDAYMTKDGQKFFPNVVDVKEAEKKKQEEKEKAAEEKNRQKEEMIKSDKPQVELFVMSHCPYGTQTEKGLLPVLDALGDKIDFELKFVSYAMHGKKELDEQLRQYCVQKNEPSKLSEYLQCFLEEGKSEECVKRSGLDPLKLKTCISSTDREYKVTEKYGDKSAWVNGRFPVFGIYKEDNEKYGVQGSPTLVINGKKVSSGRDSASLLEMICSAFNSPPEECGQQLSSTVPSPGFGFGSGSANSDASCNN
jgi:glutaredoxin